MASSKIFALAVSACALATASGLAQRHPGFSFKRSQGTVAGAENGTSYYWNSTSTIAQCPDLTTADLQTSLEQFNGLFPPEYDAGPYYAGETLFEVGALYLTYPEGTFAFDLQYSFVTPNSTATWVDSGADIANVWAAVGADIVYQWSQNITFQFIYYSVNKTINDVSNYAGQFQVQIQTPTFVKGCGTSCGGGCDPNICSQC